MMGATKGAEPLPKHVYRMKGRKFLMFRTTMVDARGIRKDRWVSLKTNDVRLAASRASGLRKSVAAGRWDLLTQMQGKRERLDGHRLLAAYDLFLESLPNPPKPMTVRDYKSGYRRVLAAVWPSRDPMSVMVDELNEDVIHRFQRVKLDALGKDHLARERAATGINTTMRNARGVFSRSARKYYERHGVSLGSQLAGFLEAAYLEEASHAFDGIEQLSKLDKSGWALQSTDPEFFKVFLLLRYFAMRPREVRYAKWEWLIETDQFRGIELRTRSYFKFKAGGGRPTYLPASDDLWTALDSFRESGDKFVVKSVDEVRKDYSVIGNAHQLITRDFSKWLRQYIPSGSKTLYQLRKQAGSEVLEMTGNPHIAAAFNRHSLKVFNAHYRKDLRAFPANGTRVI